MKKVLVLMIISFFGFLGANAQTELPKAEKVEVTIKNNNLNISWISNYTGEINWMLEASADNENFKTIGWVLGAMPGENNNQFMFKQATSKIKTNYNYYRVVAVEKSGNGWAGSSVKISK